MAGASPSPHKPRRRAAHKETGSAATTPRKLLSVGASPGPSAAAARAAEPAFPLAAFLWPARGSVSQWELLPLILMVAGLFRWATGLWGYSGFQSPPMFGDYEAQRHWMEITTQLPVSQWYSHDLQWWGLDYPPLTAYHSWLLGRVGAAVQRLVAVDGAAPERPWFALYSSRGLEDPALKLYMRATVVVSEYLVYVPAVVVCVRRLSRRSAVASWPAMAVALPAILLQPATLLVDHAHFQYNTVMLGLVTASLSSMLAARYLWAAVFFVAALGFKQMALYYALSVFTFLLAACMAPSRLRPGRLLAIAAATLASFALLVLPLVLGALRSAGYPGNSGKPDNHPDDPLPLLPAWAADRLDHSALYYPVVCQLAQMLHRVFPVARGLFEDKVANFWCAANIVVKLRHIYSSATLQKASLALTLAAVLPPNLVLFFASFVGRVSSSTANSNNSSSSSTTTTITTTKNSISASSTSTSSSKRRPKQNLADEQLPSLLLLPHALAATAWGFFLFSYQVHEKSVLLPLLPMTLLLAGHGGLAPETRAWVGFATVLAAWTLFPLLQREDLRLPYAVLTLLWAYLLGLPPTSLALYLGSGRPATPPSPHAQKLRLAEPDQAANPTSMAVAAALHLPLYLAMAVWHALDHFVVPPANKPDLWVVANVGIGAVGFGLCYLWCCWRLVAASGLLPRSRSGKAKSQ